MRDKRRLWVMEEYVDGKWLPHEGGTLTRKAARQDLLLFWATLSSNLPGDDLPRTRLRMYVPAEVEIKSE